MTVRCLARGVAVSLVVAISAFSAACGDSTTIPKQDIISDSFPYDATVHPDVDIDSDFEDSQGSELHCQPQCEGRECGDDMCGGTCGSCGMGYLCYGSACVKNPMTCNPDPIDFGQVASGQVATLDVVITNNSVFTVYLESVHLDYEGSNDFSLLAVTSKYGPVLPSEMTPGDSIGVSIEYSPVGYGCDESRLLVMGTVDGELRQWGYTVNGCEHGPRFQILPAQIDFAMVPIDTEAEKTITVFNVGNPDLIVSSVELAPGSDENLEIVNPPQTGSPVTIEPEGSHEFRVRWSPDFLPEGDQSEPIGTLKITSNDVAGSLSVVPVYGQVEAPNIEVIPTSIDFGFGAQHTPKSATLTIKNKGLGDMLVSKIEIIRPSTTAYGEEFSIVYNSVFPVTNPVSPIESTIEGNSFTPIELTFTNNGPDSGQVTATLVIHSNCKGKERIEVPLKASRSAAPVCRAQISPSILSFGTLAVGFSETMEVRLVNTGNGSCTVTGYKLADCTSSVNGSSCPNPLEGSDSQYFRILTPPPTTPGGVGSGKQVSMLIEFTPPTVMDIFNLNSRSSALFSLAVRDDVANTERVIPECEGTCNYNVVGYSGIAKAAVLPDHVDFGIVTTGCYSRSYSVCVYNSGNAPLRIEDVNLHGCTTEFHLKNIPALPGFVGSTTPICFQATYSPADEGVDQCTMHLSVRDRKAPTIAIPLRGKGTYETQHTDEFVQVTGDEVDILFVIDDSGSMCEEQDRLAASFGQFIAQAAVWENDYHIGIVSVGVLDDAVIGRLNRGDKTVTPRFITKGTDAQSQFVRLVDLGCDGGSDPQEAGLQAAQAALSAPLTTETGISCIGNSDCTSNANICADPANCPYTCIDGTCGGFNKGFLRDDARLEIIILSDEEDQSVSSVSFYADFFTAIKGWGSADRMHVHSIVGVSGVPASGSEGACVAADGGFAAEGARYILASNTTGGAVGSICESSFATIMNDIADISFNPKLQYTLSRLADAATVRVSVDHQGDENFIPMLDCWEFDAPSNSIIFSAESPCEPPQPQNHIKVSYKTLCPKS